MTRLCLALMALCLHVAASAARITLATGGQPAATIVTPEGADAKLTRAAQDLQHYVKEICRVELPIRRDGKRVAGTGLYVGQCDVTTEADLPAKGLNPETYAIRVRDGNVLFTGRWPTPIGFAVTSFIEDALGVRWFAPGVLWEHVPGGKAGELTVEVAERVKTPDTSPRIWSGHAWFPSWTTWNRRNKTVLSEVVPRRQFQNVLHRVFPPERYAKAHPEYYPLIDGKRWIPPKGSRYWRPCESNPDVIRLTVEHARKWFDDHPTIDSFSVGMDDISHLCGCAGCRALDPRPDSYAKREFSDRHYKFVNAVAREIRKTHPDRFIGTLIYHIARTPPETVPRLEDNVFGFITERSALWPWTPGRKESDHAVTLEWTKRCKHLSRYDYYGMGTFCPRVYPHTMAEQVKFDMKHGLEGMYTEVYTFLPHTAPMIWAFAKLQWDHRLDVDKLLGEFYAKMYGPAAPLMKEYFDLLERSWGEPRPGRRGWVHRHIVNQALSISPEAVDEGLGLLTRAASATGNPDIQARVATHRRGLLYASYVIHAHAISRQLLALAVTDEKSAQEALRLTDRLAALAIERERAWADAPKHDDLLGENLRGLLDKGYLTLGDVGRVEAGGLVGVTKALAWYTRHAPDKLPAVAERLARTGRGSVSDTVRAWLWLQKAKPPSLVTNGGFDDAAPNTARPEKDWTTRGAPSGWSTWSRTSRARFVTLGGKGQEGSAAASVAGAASACYLQTIQARPGDRILCMCWAKAERPDLHCGGKLSVRLRTPTGGWHPRRDMEPSVVVAEGQAGWQPLVVLVTIPEGAGAFVLMPGAAQQDEGARILFDGVAAYKLPAD